MTKMPKEPGREAAIAGGSPSEPAGSVAKSSPGFRAEHACPANRKQALHLLSLWRSPNGTGVDEGYSADCPKGRADYFCLDIQGGAG